VGAPEAVVELVERFRRQREVYRSAEYNEARLRREFLDPLFSALGWDMDNSRGYAEAYKDVIHEDSIKVGTGTRAPDYCFRIAATRKFFVEAKKPGVNIKEDTSPAYQLRRYAWTSKLPLSILTDFEEFAVYDCRIRPRVGDSASVARTTYLSFEDYPTAWDSIAETFSRDAVLRGSFDAHAEAGKGKRGTTEVDDAFLEEIEHWRELLAKNIAERNPRLGQHDINFAVQRTIDRIVFLRICEDRGVEDYGQLKRLIAGPNLYQRLVARFYRADERYNSGLFHFRNERDRAEVHDQLTPELKVDDKPLREILENLYYPSSPYEFSVLSPDILGHVYERFLGKVIRLTPSHHAKIEEKPEVRKAGGVYYTPSYVVDYMLKQTLGALLEGMSVHEASTVRVLDPACGSGSFLLGAYQLLLDWHLDAYVKGDPEKLARQKQPPVFRGRRGEWRLTACRKKEILLNSIFGVDIDAQAIEVSKLSLLLKVLEGETEETVDSALKLFHDRALPDLGQNIQHGNSLIGPEYGTSGQLRLPSIDDDAVLAFDWKARFPRVFEGGGFDVVVGNPPYLSFGGRQAVELPERVRQYYNDTYESAGWPTAHSLFLERSVKLLSRKYVSFIVPDQVGHLGGYGSIRTIVTRGGGLAEVRYWGEHVFKGVVTPALTLVVDRERPACETQVFDKHGKVSTATFAGEEPWTVSASAAVIRRLRLNAFSLDKLVGDCGIRTTSAKHQVVPLSDAKGSYVPALEGKRIQRYSCEPPTIAVRLDSRKALYVTGDERFASALFLIRQTASYPIVGPHEHATHFRNSLLALFEPADGIHVHYLVALLNSRLLRFVYTETIREAQQRTFPQVKLGALRSLPMRKIDLADPTDKHRHDDLVKLVDEALATQRRMAVERNPVRKEALQRAFEMIDARIEKGVRELYELTEQETAVVENALALLSPEGGKPGSWRPEASAPVGGPKRAQTRGTPRQSEPAAAGLGRASGSKR
jgi:hypothetical protein